MGAFIYNSFIDTDNKIIMIFQDFFIYVKEGMLALPGFEDYSKYPKLTAWKKKMSQLPYHKMTCGEPIAQFTQMYQGKLNEKA